MTGALVTTQWVVDNLDNLASQGYRLVEVDVDTTQYEQGHIPGAVAFNWQTQLQDQIARDIISQENLEQLLSSVGITPDTHILLYGDNNNWFAAYALWVLNYYGHEKTSLIDGGRKKWLADNLPTTTDVPTFPASSYKVSKINEQFRSNRDAIKSQLGREGFGLVDVRSPAEYVGDIIAPPGMSETAQRAGHIPSAANIPWAQAVLEDGTFKSKEDLAALYGGKGITGSQDEIVAYCRIGERSSHTWFVLKYILGYENVKNYDGSWTEWGNLIGNPIKKGAEA